MLKVRTTGVGESMDLSISITIYPSIVDVQFTLKLLKKTMWAIMMVSG